MFQKKIAVLLARPLVTFLAWCPNLSRRWQTVLFHRTNTCASVAKNWLWFIAGSWGSVLDPAGGAHDASPGHRVGPQWLAPAALTHYCSCLRRSSRIAVPKLWSV